MCYKYECEACYCLDPLNINLVPHIRRAPLEPARDLLSTSEAAFFNRRSERTLSGRFGRAPPRVLCVDLVPSSISKESSLANVSDS